MVFIGIDHNGYGKSILEATPNCTLVDSNQRKGSSTEGVSRYWWVQRHVLDHDSAFGVKFVSGTHSKSFQHYQYQLCQWLACYNLTGYNNIGGAVTNLKHKASSYIAYTVHYTCVISSYIVLCALCCSQFTGCTVSCICFEGMHSNGVCHHNSIYSGPVWPHAFSFTERQDKHWYNIFTIV